MKFKKGDIYIILISIIAFVLWLFPKDFIDLQLASVLIYLGELCGILGLLLFSINFILTTRFKFLENWFNGLNNVYKRHNILGQISFIFLLLHPLFLLPKYTFSFSDVFKFLFLSSDWNKNFGILSLWLMILLIILTLYLRPKYNVWFFIHKFFGLALFLGGLHSFLIPSFLQNNLLLKFYLFTFVILGLLSFIYRSILGKFLVKTFIFKVIDVKQLNNNIIEIHLSPKDFDCKFSYKPGQFIFIKFLQKGLDKEFHPFTLTSISTEKNLIITVKGLGDYTKFLVNNLHKNVLAKIEGPFGNFSYKTERKNQIWIAGGIGITPFISFLKDLEVNRGFNIKMFYCVRNFQQAVYYDFLKQCVENYKNFDFELFCSDEKGYIDLDYIKNKVKNIQDCDIFICAPPKMIFDLKKSFVNFGVSEEYIFSEDFNF